MLLPVRAVNRHCMERRAALRPFTRAFTRSGRQGSARPGARPRWRRTLDSRFRALCRRFLRLGAEVDGAGVVDRGLARLGRRVGPDLAERRAQLVDVEIDELRRSVVAERAQGPQERLAGKRTVGAERERPHHVLAGTDAAVENDGGLFARRRGDGGETIDRWTERFDLPAAVVRYPYAIDAERGSLLGILGMQHALYCHRPFPFVAIALDLFPGESAAHVLPRKLVDLVCIVRAGIFAQRGKTRIAVTEKSPQP